ncbi:unnamed protein product [Vitrella brassicaformis CCMP3155]|uniref:Uncharacterized protein n=1 Tax=Vitrella brassicaformis (strain CCMP3155) TaxID=1169540 RepID=A0A0G4G209_VITBC|nr:unnamed protein product [Vitrella brassicaformis CCMP3155]|eukprot:CEM22086.1 unnamed protein product [Vitrella brassicaformis CCMP3155]
MSDDGCRSVILPQWSSEGIIAALIDGGADINATGSDLYDLDNYRDDEDASPIRVAIASGNETAFNLLVDDIDLRGAMLLMSMYERLIDRDPTLAAERAPGCKLVHNAARNAQDHYPQPFIDSYLDLITANGADMTAAYSIKWTPAHYAAAYGSPQVADYLCRKLPAGQIDGQDGLGDMPLAIAAEERLGAQDEDDARVDNLKRIIRSLLRAGADINLIATDTEERRRRRQLVLEEYVTVLNKLRDNVMAAVNAALTHHRSLAALLTPRLAVGPQEAAIFGWRIASYLFDMDAAQEAISEAIGVRHSDMARRVCAAAKHLVLSAVYQASSNREVVGGTVHQQQQQQQQGDEDENEPGAKRAKVSVPPLQCFATDAGQDGGQHRLLGLREVVHKARLDEVAKYGLQGVEKGFNDHIVNDCDFEWGRLGHIDSSGAIVSLAESFQPHAAPVAGAGADGGGSEASQEGDDGRNGGEASEGQIGGGGDMQDGDGQAPEEYDNDGDQDTRRRTGPQPGDPDDPFARPYWWLTE